MKPHFKTNLAMNSISYGQKLEDKGMICGKC